MLELQNITKIYGKNETATTVLKDINLKVDNHELVILYGPSGSGKSTLLSIIGALLTPTNGEIILDGRSWSGMNDKERTELRLTDIGFIFQSSHLLPYLTVKDQLTFVGKESGLNKETAKDRAQKLLDSFGLSHRVKAFPKSLSGGEKQRTAIARAFMNNPKLILADEPTASLDKERAIEVVQMIKDRVKTTDTSCIMITHDTRLFDYADKLFILDNGTLTEKSVKEVRDRELITN